MFTASPATDQTNPWKVVIEKIDKGVQVEDFRRNGI